MNILKRIFNTTQVSLKQPTVFGSSYRKEHYGKEYTVSLKNWEQQEPKRCKFVEIGKYNLLVKDKYYLVHEDNLWNFEDNEDQ